MVKYLVLLLIGISALCANDWEGINRYDVERSIDLSAALHETFQTPGLGLNELAETNGFVLPATLQTVTTGFNWTSLKIATAIAAVGGLTKNITTWLQSDAIDGDDLLRAYKRGSGRQGKGAASAASQTPVKPAKSADEAARAVATRVVAQALSDVRDRLSVPALQKANTQAVLDGMLKERAEISQVLDEMLSCVDEEAPVPFTRSTSPTTSETRFTDSDEGSSATNSRPQSPDEATAYRKEILSRKMQALLEAENAMTPGIAAIIDVISKFNEQHKDAFRIVLAAIATNNPHASIKTFNEHVKEVTDLMIDFIADDVALQDAKPQSPNKQIALTDAAYRHGVFAVQKLYKGESLTKDDAETLRDALIKLIWLNRDLMRDSDLQEMADRELIKVSAKKSSVTAAWVKNKIATWRKRPCPE